MPKQPINRLILVGVLASAIGIAIGLTIHWFPRQASTQAHKIDTLYKVLVIASVPIFVLVALTILFCAWRFRMRPGQELQDGPPIHGNTRLEILWTLGPTVLIFGLVAYALVVLHQIEARPAGPELQVNVTGQQFAWSYEYPSSATGSAPLETTQLVLPLGESVNFDLRSKDVIHAFWVPAFRIQEDVVPGITTSYRITPDETGTFEVICNELCGLGHSTMRSRVQVVPKQQFESWLHRQLAIARSGGGGAGAPTVGSGTGAGSGSGGGPVYSAGGGA
jgi:cytochrome c oxidase subunit II